MEKLYSSKTALKEYYGRMHHSTQRYSFTTTACLFAKTDSDLSRTPATASPNPWGSVEPSLRTTVLERSLGNFTTTSTETSYCT